MFTDSRIFLFSNVGEGVGLYNQQILHLTAHMETFKQRNADLQCSAYCNQDAKTRLNPGKKLSSENRRKVVNERSRSLSRPFSLSPLLANNSEPPGPDTRLLSLSVIHLVSAVLPLICPIHWMKCYLADNSIVENCCHCLSIHSTQQQAKLTWKH